MTTYDEMMAKAKELHAAGDTARARRLAEIALKQKDMPAPQNEFEELAKQAAEQLQQRRANALAIQARARRQSAQPQTNLAEQIGTGTNEGIAGMAGLPVDLMTQGLNFGINGFNNMAGTDIGQIENSVGGSESIRGLLSPFMSEAEPQTTAQRYGRRIGQEAGAMAIPGGIAMRGAKTPMALAGGEVAAATGAGIAGQTSREVAPNNDTADMIASMLGGLTPAGASRAMQPTPKAPSLDQLAVESGADYDAVRASGATLSPASSDTLAGTLEGTLGPRPATRLMNPKASIAATELAGDMRTNPMTISEVDDARQWIGDNVAGSSEKGERRLGMAMKDGIDDHLASLQPQDVTGTNRPEEVIETLVRGREKAHRIHKSELFEAEDTGLVAKGIRRAATTGTGGNEVNAIRQNIRRVLDNPKLKRGYNEAELQAMREIADGTPTQNAMRTLGRLAPTAGALPFGAGTGGAAAFATTGNPLFVAPSAVGQGAKYMAERSTRKSVEQLGELIRNGGPLPKKEGTDMQKRLIAALMASQGAQQPPKENATRRKIAEALMR